jgi:hypothetical protein
LPWRSYRALNPKLLALDLLLIENRRPRAMFWCLLLGGMPTAATVGLLDVAVVHADAIKAQGTVSAGVDLVLGLSSGPPASCSPRAACTAGEGSAQAQPAQATESRPAAHDDHRPAPGRLSGHQRPGQAALTARRADGTPHVRSTATESGQLI